VFCDDLAQATKPQKFVADLLRQKGDTIEALAKQLERARQESQESASQLAQATEELAACQSDMRTVLSQRKGFEQRFQVAIGEAKKEIDHYRSLAREEVVRRQQAEANASEAAARAKKQAENSPHHSTAGNQQPSSNEQIELLRTIQRQVQQQQEVQQRLSEEHRRSDERRAAERNASYGENEPPQNRNTARATKEAGRPFNRAVQAVPDVATTDGSSLSRVSFVRQRTAKDGHALPSWYRRMRVKKT